MAQPFPRFSRWRSGLVACATVLASASVCGAVVFSDDYTPIDGEDNQAVVILNATAEGTSDVIDCLGRPSFIELTYDTDLDQLTVEDADLCGTDLPFGAGVLLEVREIEVAAGPTAEALDCPPGDPTEFLPVTADIGPAGAVAFTDVPIRFRGVLVILGVPQDPICVSELVDLSGNLVTNEVTGRLEVVDLVGTFTAVVVVPEPIGEALVQVDLTFNVEGSGIPPIFLGDFESGTTAPWTGVSGV